MVFISICGQVILNGIMIGGQILPKECFKWEWIFYTSVDWCMNYNVKVKRPVMWYGGRGLLFGVKAK